MNKEIEMLVKEEKKKKTKRTTYTTRFSEVNGEINVDEIIYTGQSWRYARKYYDIYREILFILYDEGYKGNDSNKITEEFFKGGSRITELTTDKMVRKIIIDAETK